MVILRKRNLFEKRKSLNGRCNSYRLSQERGPPQGAVVELVAAESSDFPHSTNDRLEPDPGDGSVTGRMGSAIGSIFDGRLASA
jgi:hypothetical protein